MPKKMLLILAVTAAAMFAFAGCGDDEDDSAGDSAEPAATTETSESGDSADGGDTDVEGGTVAIEADPGGGLSYTTGEVATSAGEVTIEFTNEASTPHDVKVEGDSGDLGGTDVISGDSTTATVELEAGSYTYYCSVSGHREAGMEGTLTAE